MKRPLQLPLSLGFCLLVFGSVLTLSGCSSKPPSLSGFKAQDFPVYAPSTVESSMGAETGETFNDPNASHHLTYWLQSESKPEKIVEFYKSKMSQLPAAKEVTGEAKFDGASFQMKCGAISNKELVESYEMLVEKDQKDGKSVFRITETLKPGKKYD